MKIVITNSNDEHEAIKLQTKEKTVITNACKIRHLKNYKLKKQLIVSI